jgi:hypothetical protein
VVVTVGAVRLDFTLVALSLALTITFTVTLGVALGIALSLALTVIVTLTGLLAIANILHVAVVGAARAVTITAVSATLIVAVAAGRQLAG